jgi:hypothetical protein
MPSSSPASSAVTGECRLLATIPLDEWIGLGATQYVLELHDEGEEVRKPTACHGPRVAAPLRHRAMISARWHKGVGPPTYSRMLWRTPRRSRRTPPAGFILPCQPLLVDRPPAGSDWLHEIKHDGYRILARKEGSRVTLWSRHGTNFTDRLPKVA